MFPKRLEVLDTSVTGGNWTANCGSTPVPPVAEIKRLRKSISNQQIVKSVRTFNEIENGEINVYPHHNSKVLELTLCTYS